ncbi:hypothetical protein DXG01_006435, partial [Tephrocybe rancida]
TTPTAFSTATVPLTSSKPPSITPTVAAIPPTILPDYPVEAWRTVVPPESSFSFSATSIGALTPAATMSAAPTSDSATAPPGNSSGRVTDTQDSDPAVGVASTTSVLSGNGVG